MPYGDQTGRDHEAGPDGWASPAAPPTASSMIMGSFGQIGPCSKSENVRSARRLTIEATIQL
jgi:hypothetical protein